MIREEVRFWDKVAMSDGCWTWTGTSSEGYGRFTLDGRVRKAHRVAYEMLNGPIPKGLYICHRCDNPSCVRPSHLYAGTQRDNMRDRDSKGRGADHRGEAHGRARLTDSAVREIRVRLANGERPTHIAQEFGVSRSAIRFIANGAHWRHVA